MKGILGGWIQVDLIILHQEVTMEEADMTVIAVAAPPPLMMMMPICIVQPTPCQC